MGSAGRRQQRVLEQIPGGFDLHALTLKTRKGRKAYFSSQLAKLLYAQEALHNGSSASLAIIFRFID